jgi:hypothetical protein
MTRSDQPTDPGSSSLNGASARRSGLTRGGRARSLAVRGRRGALGVPLLIAFGAAGLGLVLGVVLLALAVVADLVVRVADLPAISWAGSMAAAGAALDVTAVCSFGILLWVSGLSDAWRHPPRWGSSRVARVADHLVRGVGTLAVAAAALICVVCTWVVLANVATGAYEFLVDGTVGEPTRTGVLVGAVLSLVTAIPAVVIATFAFWRIRFPEA